MLKKIFIFFVILFFLIVTYSYSQIRGNDWFNKDKRGEVDLVVCQQNLENYGLENDIKTRVGKKFTKEDLYMKEVSLVKRFSFVGCDVIAFQELLGNDKSANLAIKRFVRLLSNMTGRTYEYYLGKSNDKTIRTGFIVAKDRAEVLGTASYANVELPKLMSEEKPRFFSRGPFELQLRVKAKGRNDTKRVNLITFHFKSKARGQNDPAKTQWETLRMQQSEALRRIVENRFKNAIDSGEQILILLGDRNSDKNSASSKILNGSNTLKMFQDEAPCRLSKNQEALCLPNTTKPPMFISVLTQDPETKLMLGSFNYNHKYSWIDEILMPAKSLPFAWENYAIEGNYASGVYRGYPKASDHALVYVRLNF